MKNKTVVLDLTECEHVGKIQPRIQEAFGFPDSYGKNWSAFKDYLFYEYPVSKVIIIGADTLPPIFNKDLKILCEILKKAKEDYGRSNLDFEYEFRPNEEKNNA